MAWNNQQHTGKPTSSRGGGGYNPNYNNGAQVWNMHSQHGYQQQNQRNDAHNGLYQNQYEMHGVAPVPAGFAPNPWMQNQGYGYNGQHVMSMNHAGPPYGHNSMDQRMHSSISPNSQRTSFNVNAVEFVPRAKMTPSPNMQQDAAFGPAPGRVVVVDERCQQENYDYPNYIQPASMSAGNNPYDESNEFGGTENMFIPSQSVYEKISASPCQNSLQEVVVGLETLLSDYETPLEVWASCIRDRLTAPNMNIEARKLACQIINEMAVGATPAEFENSVQNVLARVVSFLAIEIPRIVPEALLPSMQLYHETRAELDIDRKCNLLLFFAEVYARVETDGGSHIVALGGAFLDQVSDILKNQEQVTDASVAYITYALKITGPHLDVNGAYDRLSDVLTRLSGFARGSQMLSEQAKNEINRLVDMRQNKWPSIKKATSNSALHLSEEERAFMEMQLNQLESSDDPDTESLDEDILNEYGRFVDESLKDDEAAESLVRKLEEEDVEKKMDNLKVEDKQETQQ